MKLSLRVCVGKSEGKVIPVLTPQFLIGRDADCQLRPASPIISKRHCALMIRDGKAYIVDYESMNGTLVNEQRVQGEQELHDQDSLKIGPLAFTVQIEAPQPTVAPPPPPPKPAEANGDEDDDAMAAMLLAMHEDGAPANGAVLSEVPEGSTVLDMPAVQPPPEEEGKQKPEADKKSGKPKPEANTASAAEAILQRYSRRNRREAAH
jgi:predicted component of type VI protein secretion system